MDLAELLATQSNGRSYEQLQADCGGRLSAERLEEIATGELTEFPDPDSIRSLARGLRIPETAVVLAAAESLGLDVPGGAGASGVAVVSGPTPESAQEMRNVETLHGADVERLEEE